jgi:hypothetical protein
LGVLGGGTFVTSRGSETPMDDRNETSLSYRLEVSILDIPQDQETSFTFQGLVSKKRYIWCYTVGKFIEGVEEGGLVGWDSGSIQETGLAEHIRRNILQRVTRNLCKNLQIEQCDLGCDAFTSRTSTI